jgi:hypothetical protein
MRFLSREEVGQKFGFLIQTMNTLNKKKFAELPMMKLRFLRFFQIPIESHGIWVWEASGVLKPWF